MGGVVKVQPEGEVQEPDVLGDVAIATHVEHRLHNRRDPGVLCQYRIDVLDPGVLASVVHVREGYVVASDVRVVTAVHLSNIHAVVEEVYLITKKKKTYQLTKSEDVQLSKCDLVYVKWVETTARLHRFGYIII